MTTNEWREGYKAGFEDGYEKAKRELHRSPVVPTNPFPYGGIEHVHYDSPFTTPPNYNGIRINSSTGSKARFGSFTGDNHMNMTTGSFNYDNGHDGETGC